MGKKIAVTLLIIVGVSLLFFSGKLFSQKIFEEMNAVEISAVISNISVTGTGKNKEVKVFVTYSYNGVEYKSMPINYSNSDMRVGNIIKIKVNEMDPSEIYGDIYFIIVILFFFSLILFAVSIYLITTIKKDNGIEDDINTIQYHSTEENINSIVWEKANSQISEKISNILIKKKQQDKINALIVSIPFFSFTLPMIYFVFLEFSKGGELIVKILFLVLLVFFVLMWIIGVLIPTFFIKESFVNNYLVFEAKCIDVGRTTMLGSRGITKYYGYFQINGHNIFTRIEPDEYRNSAAIGKNYIFYKVDYSGGTKYKFNNKKSKQLNAIMFDKLNDST
ncbi:hypothetical protein [Culicoidibacter larvae]|uniref:DUF3592 domain-containing protein n=1 Tax=Culicoidibacter larvae TaxID=2579976 RepID=A0A5R8QCM7_9FIRM|nr:hypothetical protein [Culicoidibacter larvae]TLG74319.1 hypothetical protein FEZ08_06325 [Culicoidibacter larvae]